MLMSSALSLCIGVGVTLWKESFWPGLEKCLDGQSIRAVLPVNLFFQTAFVLKFEALRQLDPDIVSLLSQVNLVLLAVAARIFFRRRYNYYQWGSLVMVSFSIMAYLTTRNMEGLSWSSFWGPLKTKFSTQIEGYFCIVFMCVIEICATVLAEKFLKGGLGRKGAPREEQVHFWVQKVHVDISGLTILLCFWIFLRWKCPNESFDWICKPVHYQKIMDDGLLSGWDRWTGAVLILSISKAWLAGWVSKHLDSVVKQIGSCVALVLTYAEVQLMAWEIPQIPTVLSLVLVLVWIWRFFRAGRKPTAVKADFAYVESYRGPPSSLRSRTARKRALSESFLDIVSTSFPFRFRRLGLQVRCSATSGALFASSPPPNEVP